MSLELRDIHKHFGPVRANDGISLSVASGSLHGLLGENGAGKSTLMKILSGFYVADAGEILLDGRSVALGSPRRPPPRASACCTRTRSCSCPCPCSTTSCWPARADCASTAVGPGASSSSCATVSASRTRPRRPGTHPHGRRTPAARDHAPPVAGHARAHPRRAHDRDLRRPARAALRDAAHARRRRHERHLRLAQARGGRGALRRGHGHARAAVSSVRP